MFIESGMSNLDDAFLAVCGVVRSSSSHFSTLNKDDAVAAVQHETNCKNTGFHSSFVLSRFNRLVLLRFCHHPVLSCAVSHSSHAGYTLFCLHFTYMPALDM